MAVLNGPVGDSLVSLHISDQFQGARVPEGEEMDPICKALILVFDMTDVELTATTCIKVITGLWSPATEQSVTILDSY